MNYIQFKEEVLPFLREITRFQLKTVHPDHVEREGRIRKRANDYGTDDFSIFTITLFQRVTEPWEFILFTDFGISGLAAHDSWKKTHFPHQVFEIYEGRFSNFTEFKRYFDQRYFKEPGKSILQYLPITFLKKNKPIDRDLFCKFLFHAVSHPEQYESESLDVAIEKLIDEYENFSFKH